LREQKVITLLTAPTYQVVLLLEGLKEGEIAIPEPSTKAVSIEVTA
jgi:hypothetical protein